jgi:magnesium transporter
MMGRLKSDQGQLFYEFHLGDAVPEDQERAADIVEALNDMPPELAVAVLLHLPPDRAIEVLDQPGLEREPELIMLMPRTVAAKLLAGVSADRLADIFRQVEEPHCSELLDLLDPDTRVNIRRLLEYPKHTAGSIMTTEFASVPSTYTVGQNIEKALPLGVQ